MQREIKFRGKRLDNGEWVYGYPCYIDNELIIITGYVKQVDGALFHCNTFYFVIPETVGQYLGCKDKNGEEIYEGDIVLYNRNIDEEVDCYKYEVVFHRDQYGLKELKFGYYLWDVQWDMTEVIKSAHNNVKSIVKAVTQKNYPHTMQLGDVTKIDWNAFLDRKVEYPKDDTF